MAITIKQLRGADYSKLGQFIKGLEYGDLNNLYCQFETLIEKLFNNGFDGTDEYTKALHIQIDIINAMGEIEKGLK
jgi:hypothetical protein